jgi:SOS-response transcriptional repressor LexA
MKKPEQYKVVELEVLGEIGAGQVVEFIPRNRVIPVALPSGADPEHYGSLIVRGVSLEDEAIFDGDLLILRKNITNKDIARETICAVYIRSTGELVAKKLSYGNHGEYVTLRSSGGGIEDVHYHKDDIEVRGIAIGFQRMLRDDRNLDPNIPF